MVQIKIKDKGFLDLYEGASVGFVWKNPMLYEEKSSTRSVNIKIPYTENNRAIFACADMVASMGNGIRQLKDAVFYDDAVALECSLYVTGADDNAREYSVLLVYNIEEKGFEMLREIKMNSLDTGRRTNNYRDYIKNREIGAYEATEDNILNKTAALNKYYTYTEVDKYGEVVQPGSEASGLFRLPTLGLFTLFSDLCGLHGIRYSIREDKIGYLRKLVYKPDGLQLKKINRNYLADSKYSLFFEEVPDAKITIMAWNNTTHTYFNKELEGTAYKARVDMFVYRPIVDYGVINAFFVVYNSNGKWSELAQYESGYDTDDLTIKKGEENGFIVKKDQYLFAAKKSAAHRNINHWGIFIEGTANATLADVAAEQSYSLICKPKEALQIQKDNLYYNSWVLPEWSLLDVVRIFCYLTDSVYYYRNKTIYITEVTAQENNAVPIDDKVIKRGEVTRKYMDFAQNNIIKFDNNEWVQEEWQLTENYEVQNPNLSEKKDLYTFPFSGSNWFLSASGIRANEADYEWNGTEGEPGGEHVLKSDIKPTLMMLYARPPQTYSEELSPIFSYNTWVVLLGVNKPDSVQTDPSFSKMVQASTQIKVTIKMSCFEFFSIKPETIYRYEGVKWIATDINWSKGAATMTLQKLADF